MLLATARRRSSLPLLVVAMLVLATIPLATPRADAIAAGPCPAAGTTDDASPVPGAARIHDIQGSTHVSPCLDHDLVAVPGIVTVVAGNRFWMQDPEPDSTDATSEGLLVFVGSQPKVLDGGVERLLAAGDGVRVSGTVAEFRAGPPSSQYLATTEIADVTAIVLDPVLGVVEPVVLGPGGRMPPTQIIEDSAGGTDLGGTFEPTVDGLDFWESLEGMLVAIDDAVVVGPQFRANELNTREPHSLPVLAADGAGATGRTARMGILVSEGIPVADFNPERIFLGSRLLPGNPEFPGLNTGDHSEERIAGILDYSWGRYQLQVLLPVNFISGGVLPETTVAAGPNELTIATFNVENLDANDDAAKYDRLAGIIVDNLRAPDLLVLEEVQDNSGAVVGDGVVDATETTDTLITAITEAGGPVMPDGTSAYDYVDVDPVEGHDGGEPGGNIRVGFLFRTDRGLAFLGGTAGDATTAVAVLPGPALSHNPGRIDPTNPAFSGAGDFSASRKPLVGAFTYNGHPVFVIGVHFNSKGPDDPLYGTSQPPMFHSEAQRSLQAQVVRDFVNATLDQDLDANVIVLGDVNDFAFSAAVDTLADGGSPGRNLEVLLTRLPANEQYSYVYEGNSQTLDQMLVTRDWRRLWSATGSTWSMSTPSSPTKPATMIRRWRGSWCRRLRLGRRSCWDSGSRAAR